jgi:bifunctional non-homologous end joining protein LigD
MSTKTARAGRQKLAEYWNKRDFHRTKEPQGNVRSPAPKTSLRFVIQKHAASHLHYDLRLELDGVMKSWAVPKGPSTDSAIKRLAMEVEDHPIDYNSFEGTIPKGEYGGGTVMLWDRGTYSPLDDEDSDPHSIIRRDYDAGELRIRFDGERLQGAYSLIRMRRPGRPQWLFIKQRDEFADQTPDVVDEYTTSVDTGRTMDEIAGGESPRRNRKRRAPRTSKRISAPLKAPPAMPRTVEPMYASIGSEIPKGTWVFEPKYDGVRVLAFATPTSTRLITRNGLDKSKQFPEVTAAVTALSKRLSKPFVLDGEIVALDGKGNPLRFQVLQARMHVKDRLAISRHVEDTPAALIVFDLLMDGDVALIRETWTERRKHLEALIRPTRNGRLMLSEVLRGKPATMLERAMRAGWEGVIAKAAESRYEPGQRSKAWLKLKVEYRQEFVIGGFTEPRNSREHLGALLLGYFEGDELVYAGHTGGGFTRSGLGEMYKRLAPLERKTSPFVKQPRTNEKAHWVRPQIVVEVKFSEWTSDGKLRQPIFLGVRDDKDPKEVRRERTSVQKKARPRKVRG